MSFSTVTLQQVVTFAQQHTQLMPLTGVGGTANEPALSLANDTMNFLLARPFPWKFNRKEMPIFVTVPNKQDYKFAGACAFTTTGGGVGIDLTSNNAIVQVSTTVTVNLLESCIGVFNVGDTVFLAGVTQPAIAAVYTPGQGNNGTSSVWSNGFTIVSIAANGLSFTFTYAPVISTDGAPGIVDFSWLESATMIQTANTAVVPYIWYLQGVRTIEVASRVGIPDRISVLQDLGTGVIRLRLRFVPGSQPFTVSPIYQKKPPLLTSLSSTWAPIPDNYIHCVRQMFLALCYRFADSNKQDSEYQKAVMLAADTSGADDRDEAEEYIVPDDSLMSGFGWGGGVFW
jgi:hypothetical protein